MKKITFFLSMILCGQYLFAQDIVIFRNTEATEMNGRVKSVNNHIVKFLPAEAETNKPLRLSKDKIELIIYEDGMKQYFATVDYQPDTLVFASAGSPVNAMNPEDSYLQGEIDAASLYRGNGPFWGTLVPSAIPGIGIFAGVVSGGIIISIPPNVNPYSLPNPELYLKNADYAKGYEKQVKRKKLARALAGYGIGIAVQTVFFLMVVYSY